MAFRASLEAKLAETFKIPIVVLVVGGGPNTAFSVHEAVQKRTPCVFLEVSFRIKKYFQKNINVLFKIKSYYSLQAKWNMDFRLQ